MRGDLEGDEVDGAAAVLTDLPAAWTVAAADGSKLPVLNLYTAADSLRGADCRKNLLHIGPSERMRADAIAQTLVTRNWRTVLLLVSQDAADADRGAVAAYERTLEARPDFAPAGQNLARLWLRQGK